MSRPLLGLLVALSCAAAGWFYGRHRRESDARAEAAAAAAAAQAASSSTPTATAPLPSEPPPDLPSDARQGDSVPRGLE